MTTLHRGKFWPVWRPARLWVGGTPWPLWPPTEWQWSVDAWDPPGSPAPLSDRAIFGVWPPPDPTCATWSGTIVPSGLNWPIWVYTGTTGLGPDNDDSIRWQMISSTGFPNIICPWIALAGRDYSSIRLTRGTDWTLAVTSGYHPKTWVQFDAVRWTASPQPPLSSPF